MNNNVVIDLQKVELKPYHQFHDEVCQELALDDAHILHYFAMPCTEARVTFALYCIVMRDERKEFEVFATKVRISDELQSITSAHYEAHPFEREIYEQYGLTFLQHPWLKPLRYAFDRKDQQSTMYDYPFYQIKSEELHRVGVGPIHAGIIEPGHFRFICEGEKILHLEIQLGWQHRGVEHVMLNSPKLLTKSTLAEGIAGDTVVGHATAFARAIEALSGWECPEWLELDRAIALEQERIAINTGDLSAICTDVAYQLGNAVFGRLRTPQINFLQQWCGSRFAKNLIRPYKTNFVFTPELAETWKGVQAKYLPHFTEMAEQMFDLPSVLSRIERTGVVNTETARNIGLVGMAGKASGLARDVRANLPWGAYKGMDYKAVTQSTGDVYARARMRYDEIKTSEELINRFIEKKQSLGNWGEAGCVNGVDYRNLPKLKANAMTISVTEGWRGEICHVALTDEEGNLKAYKVKDPSVHNWLGLALAVRGQGISDFPICNKSFDLSYCGHDL